MAWLQTVKKGGDRRSTLFVVKWREPDSAKERSKSFRSLTDAKSFKSEVEADLVRGVYNSRAQPEMLLNDYVVLWRRGWTASNNRRAAVECYLKHHILPALGNKPLGSINAPTIKEFTASLSRVDGKPMARSSAESVSNVLRRLLRSAVEDEILNTYRWPRDLPLPEAKPSTVVFLTHSECDRLIEAMDDRYKAMSLLMADCGLRFSEARALRLDNIDLDRHKVTISESFEEVAGRITTKPPKNGKVRTLTLTTRTVKAIRHHMATYNRGAYGLLFVGPRGAKIRHSNFVRRPWNDAVAKAKLQRRPTPHDLRHSHASWLIAAGVDIKSVSIRLGHSSSVITLDIYGHLMGDADEIAVKRLESARKKSLRLAERVGSGTKAEQNPAETEPEQAASL